MARRRMFFIKRSRGDTFKAALSLCCVSGSLKGALNEVLGEIVYVYSNNTDMTTTQTEMMFYSLLDDGILSANVAFF